MVRPSRRPALAPVDMCYCHVQRKSLPPRANFWGLQAAEKHSNLKEEGRASGLRQPAEDEGCMNVPLQIAFHGVDHSDAVEDSIRTAVGKLEKLNGRITGCRVAVEGRNHEAETRRVALRIRVDVTVPGSQLVVTEEPEEGRRHDVQGAIRRAFAAMERQLQEHRDRKHK